MTAVNLSCDCQKSCLPGGLGDQPATPVEVTLTSSPAGGPWLAWSNIPSEIESLTPAVKMAVAGIMILGRRSGDLGTALNCWYLPAVDGQAFPGAAEY
jgi:hypothetical protein